MQPEYALGISPRQLPNRVSPRERQVLELAELTRKDIGLALGISDQTVKAHLRHLFLVSGAETRAGLVAWRERKLAA